jgi:hypothetical protein
LGLKNRVKSLKKCATWPEKGHAENWKSVKWLLKRLPKLKEAKYIVLGKMS